MALGTVSSALAAAKKESARKTPYAPDQCLVHVRTWWGLTRGIPSAAGQWSASRKKHPGDATDAPAGAPVLWTGGSHGAGHIAMAVGDGQHVWTTDLGQTGYTSKETIAEVHAKWGLHLEGWIGDLEGVTLPLGAAPVKPAPPTPKPVTVSLANVQAAAAKDPKAPQGSVSYKADVLPVEQALAAEGLLGAAMVDGSFGTATVAAYGAWQKRLGYTGAQANGIPGHASLFELGHRHGWAVA